MKNLANCKPSEFLKQTYRIKKSVERWLTDTDIMNIRKNLPEFTKVTKEMTEEDRERTFEENRKKREARVYENFMKILDAVMDTHADETLEIIALCLFVEPSEFDDHSVSYYLNGISELISDEDVLNFFTSLARLVNANTPIVSQA